MKNMIESLYLDDMRLKEFEAEVFSVTDGKFIVLTQTAFYPKSGGIANDEGYLVKESETYKVVYAGKFGGKISHEVDKEGLKVGDKITGTIDWERRYKLMRYHTAAHVLSGVFYKNLGAKITGNDISTLDQGRIDFNLENFDRSLIEEQVKTGLSGLTKEESKGLVVAYEPIWAIGTGKTATPEEAEEVQRFIRKLLGQMFGKENAQAIRILYGGSINPDNISVLMSCEDIDGGLIGGASLNVESFLKVVRY